MKRLLVVFVLCAVLAFTGIVPALAGGGNQGGISGYLADGSPYTFLGYNLMPGAVVFPLYAQDVAEPVGTASFRLTWCQGYIGCRVNVPCLEEDAVLKVLCGDEIVVALDADSLVDKSKAEGLNAECFISYADVPDDNRFMDVENPSGMPYPSIMKLYEMLASGEARVEVAASNGSVSGMAK